MTSEARSAGIFGSTAAIRPSATATSVRCRKRRPGATTSPLRIGMSNLGAPGAAFPAAGANSPRNKSRRIMAGSYRNRRFK